MYTRGPLVPDPGSATGVDGGDDLPACTGSAFFALSSAAGGALAAGSGVLSGFGDDAFEGVGLDFASTLSGW